MPWSAIFISQILFLQIIELRSAIDEKEFCETAPRDDLHFWCLQLRAMDRMARNLENASVVPSEKRSFNTPPQSVYECFNMTCVCGFMGGSMTSGTCRLKNGMIVGQTIRKEYRVLTDDERNRFHKALWSIKNSGVYDYLSRIHTRFAVSTGAHAGPAFVPWHREFLKRVEIALRMVDPSMALPYWDSTMDSRLTKPEHSVLWSSELLGGSKPGEVKDGPFAGWMLESKARVIKRDVGKLSAPMPIDDVQTYMSRNVTLDQILASPAAQNDCPIKKTWKQLELSHGMPHLFVGEDMVLTASSANDPTFFLHHSFIDFIWESWRQATQTRQTRETDYPKDDIRCSSAAHFRSAQLLPFLPMLNIDALSNEYTDNLYRYSPPPTCSSRNPSCGSKFLFCDLSHGEPGCASKIVAGGDCSNFYNGEDCCYKSTCKDNVCVSAAARPVNKDGPISNTDGSSSANVTRKRIEPALPPSSEAKPVEKDGLSSSSNKNNIEGASRKISSDSKNETRKRIEPALLPPLDEPCLNEYECCDLWASSGQCQENPTFMRLSCKVSCYVCTPEVRTPLDCADRSVFCRADRCRSQTVWMKENCRKTCNFCAKTREQACTVFVLHDDASVAENKIIASDVQSVKQHRQAPMVTLKVLTLLSSYLIVQVRNNQVGLDAWCHSAPDDSLRFWCLQLRDMDRMARRLEEGRVVPSLKRTYNTPARTIYECFNLTCVCGFMGGSTGTGRCILRNGVLLNQAYRKEYRALTDDERNRFHSAMWAIKNSGVYDYFARIHSRFAIATGAHAGPAFVPWHREYLKRLEFALRTVDPSVAIPYWDSTLDSRLPSPGHSVLWTDELLGGSRYGEVRDGAFRGWLLENRTRIIRRAVGVSSRPINVTAFLTFINSPNIQQLLASPAAQEDCPIPRTWQALELVHGSPHLFVGDDMVLLVNSANDPTFFLHHSFVDYIWETWRQGVQPRQNRESEYPRDDSRCSSTAHFAHAPMLPFSPMLNIDGLSNEYTDFLYRYAGRPTCSYNNRNCGSRYLFCDVSHGPPQCASKVVPYGNCTGFLYGEDVCYRSTCRRGTCAVNSARFRNPEAPVLTAATTTALAISSPILPQQQPSSGAPILKAECFNDDECCDLWAENGQCSSNPTYMSTFCKASCLICMPNYTNSSDCSDRSNSCTRSSCGSHPGWMRENCRKTCGFCDRTRLQSCTDSSLSPRLDNRTF